jgi:hypothetical protein
MCGVIVVLMSAPATLELFLCSGALVEIPEGWDVCPPTADALKVSSSSSSSSSGSSSSSHSYSMNPCVVPQSCVIE